MAIKAKPLKKLSSKEKPFLDNKDGGDFAWPFALFEGGELSAVDYARKITGPQTPPAFAAKLKEGDPTTFVLQFEYYETAPPMLFGILCKTKAIDGKSVPPQVDNVVIAKAITAVESLRPKIWPNTKDPSTVGTYRPQDNGHKYMVQKTYPGADHVSYFDCETDSYTSWSPDKDKAHVFPTYEDAFVFAKRTESAHAERIRGGKAAASNVAILTVE
jgi:hypothetical protein